VVVVVVVVDAKTCPSTEWILPTRGRGEEARPCALFSILASEGDDPREAAAEEEEV